MPTLTSWVNCLVYDDRGDFPGIRYLSVSELARVSGFDDEDTVTFLKQCAPRNAHRYLDNAVTGERIIIFMMHSKSHCAPIQILRRFPIT